jgi:hypothetical protein
LLSRPAIRDGRFELPEHSSVTAMSRRSGRAMISASVSSRGRSTSPPIRSRNVAASTSGVVVWWKA